MKHNSPIKNGKIYLRHFSSLTRTLCYTLLLVTFAKTLLANRSIYHPKTPVQQIAVTWADSTSEKPEPTYTLTSSFLEEWAIFRRFDINFHLKHQLPNVISYRNEPEKTVAKEILDSLIEKFLKELLTHKKSTDTFTDFKVLKDDDFNYRRGCGIIIAKFKKYPFVLKLFRETPETFVTPYSKGFVPIWIYILGGGINRFLSGFTRIPNLRAINEKVAADSRWSQIVSTPRKFFWLPTQVRWFTVTGKNFGPETLTAKFPSVYGIVCDEIIAERTLQITKKEDRILGLDLGRFIGDLVDPHICNFIIEKGTGKIALIDTENFASTTGSKERVEFNSYTAYYLKLSNNCIKRALFRSKAARKKWVTGIPPNLVLST